MKQSLLKHIEYSTDHAFTATHRHGNGLQYHDNTFTGSKSSSNGKEETRMNIYFNITSLFYNNDNYCNYTSCTHACTLRSSSKYYIAFKVFNTTSSIKIITYTVKFLHCLINALCRKYQNFTSIHFPTLTLTCILYMYTRI